jgi:hypothetical protein
MKPKVLYFINTPQPSNYDRQVAGTLTAAVSFRNIKNIKPTDKAEACDGVTGVVIPAQYQDKPTAKEAMTVFNAKETVDKTAIAEAPAPVVAT